MAVFTVHVPADAADPLQRADRTIFVRDGFNVPAFVFGPLFFLYRGLWIAALGWCVVAAALAFLIRALDLSSGAAGILFALLALVTGLEANERRRGALARRGFIPAALFAGVGREESERLFFGAASAPFDSPPTGGAGGRATAPSDDEVIGLFPRPGDGG